MKGRVYNGIELKEGMNPIAEEYQKKIMLFKTNYRDLAEARKDIDLLSVLIDEIGR
jgi:hypothetical protein